MANKAHTATLNRICARYGFVPNPSGPHDIKAEGVIIDVETSASVTEAVERLKNIGCPAYIAITNNEGIKYTKQKVTGTDIGVMDPRGNILLPSGSHVLDSSESNN